MKVSYRMVHSYAACAPETPLREAVHLMWNYNYGILTEGDLSTVGNIRGLSAGQIASPDVATCGPDDDINKALETMDRRQISGLPVSDSQGLLRGILYRHDICFETDLEPKDVREIFSK
jgi:predicted transcriptional regulator